MSLFMIKDGESLVDAYASLDALRMRIKVTLMSMMRLSSQRLSQ
jgi:hypothetical protein